MTQAAFYKMPRELYDQVFSALASSGLPTDGLDCADVEMFGMSDYRGPVGYIGLEGQGRDRLLRSLVILEEHRGQGFGKRLVDRLELRASIDTKRFHLLTETATPFFRALGYVETPRTSAPGAIAATSQFLSICPASVTYLVKELK